MKTLITIRTSFSVWLLCCLVWDEKTFPIHAFSIPSLMRRDCYSPLEKQRIAQLDCLGRHGGVDSGGEVQDTGIPGSSTSITAKSIFSTAPVPLYIEDTDAYGVMFNGNYLKWFERALHDALIHDDHDTNNPFLVNNGENASQGPQQKNRIRRPIIVGMECQKFLASPVLGSEFVIEGKQLENDGSGPYEEWDLTMRDATGSLVYSAVSRLRVIRAHSTYGNSDQSQNGSTGNQIHTPSFHDVDWLRNKMMHLPGMVKRSEFQVYADELDYAARLPLRTILNYWERSRTNWLGGPTVLERMRMDESGIIVVVTKIEDCQICDPISLPPCFPGERVTVETSVIIRKRGMISTLHQFLVWRDQRIAQAKITLMTLDEQTRRPTSRIPVYMEEIMGFTSGPK